MRNTDVQLGGPQRNKVGVDDETKCLLAELKDETGITHVRIVREAVEDWAKRSRASRSRRRQPTRVTACTVTRGARG